MLADTLRTRIAHWLQGAADTPQNAASDAPHPIQPVAPASHDALASLASVKAGWHIVAHDVVVSSGFRGLSTIMCGVITYDDQMEDEE